MTAGDRLERLAALRPPARDLPQPLPFAATRTSQPLPQTEEECMLARMIGATVAQTKFGNHLSVRTWHATPEFCAPAARVIALLQRAATQKQPCDPDPLLADPEKWLFLDSETTGLSGGTGTYAFLIGIAWWDAGGLQVEQFLMRDFSEEHSVLLELAKRLLERPVLVTFNGKTFDWPLLESRYLMTRSIRVPQLAAHLDLLHPARAVWKLRLGSVKLMDLEEHVLDARRLGWDRSDDVPSAMIPQFYFDYLRGRSVAPLAGVVRHNRNDLRGLAALLGKLNEMLGSDEYSDDADGLDLFGLSRYLDRRGERCRARAVCSAARDRGLPIAYDAIARWNLAKMAKRNGEHEAAKQIWQELVQDADWRVAACEELASFHERRGKDFRKALDYARQAIAALRKRTERVADAADLRRLERLETRVGRLRKRLEKAAPSGPLLERTGVDAN